MRFVGLLICLSMTFSVTSHARDTIFDLMEAGLSGQFSAKATVIKLGYTDYSDLAASQLQLFGSFKGVTRSAFYKPVVVVQDAERTHIFSVEPSGELTQIYVFSASEPGAMIVRTIVQDPTAAGDSLELDLIKIWNANRPVYYSPELKTVIGGGQILQIKPENGPYEVSTEKLLKVRSVNLKVAEAFEAAELELQNMKFVYTSNWQRQFEVREYETAVRAMRGNRLLPRRLLSQNMALNGKVVSPTERENLATQAMKNYRFAISTLQTELNRTTSAPSTFDCMGALIGKKGQPSVK